jgi:hypothetical protein
MQWAAVIEQMRTCIEWCFLFHNTGATPADCATRLQDCDEMTAPRRLKGRGKSCQPTSDYYNLGHNRSSLDDLKKASGWARRQSLDATGLGLL